MRRFQALLIAAGLAAAPAGAAAGPSTPPRSPTPTFEKFEWSSTSKGRLGVMVMSLTPELREHFGAAADRGVLVAHVEAGTPAAAAGIAVGDVIVEVGKTAVDSTMDVLSALSTVDKGQSVAVQVIRDGKPRALRATLTDAPGRAAGAFDDGWFERFRDMMLPPKPKGMTERS